MKPVSDIRRHVLSDGEVSVAILSLGCITQDWRVPLDGARVPVVLGYRDIDDYRHNPAYLGVIAGRVVNRISGAAFELDGQRHQLDANETPHCLHGGAGGLSTRLWEMQGDGARAVRLSYVSPDGEAGFPGRAEFEITISLDGFRLHYDMRARVDRPTPINLAQHSYYNLAGTGAIAEHRLRIAAEHYTPSRADLIPTGEILALDGRSFDFRREKTIAAGDPRNRGLDMNFVRDPTAPVAATLRAPSGMTLRISTDQPGLQLYTARHLGRHGTPLDGQEHSPLGAVCLEPQGFPGALHNPQFPSIIATPERPYAQRLDVSIAHEEEAP